MNSALALYDEDFALAQFERLLRNPNFHNPPRWPTFLDTFIRTGRVPVSVHPPPPASPNIVFSNFFSRQASITAARKKPHP